LAVTPGFYWLPLLPLATRGLFVVWPFQGELQCNPDEEQQARDEHRGYAINLAGFTFSAFLAVALLGATTQAGLSVTVYYLLLSFLGYFASICIQSYKAQLWQDQIGTIALDIGTLSLLLAISSVLYVGALTLTMSLILTFIVAATWTTDHVIRLYILRTHLEGVRHGEAEEDLDDATDRT
jgi:hypothetical protein